MTPVIQIYKSMVRLEKPDYTTEARQLLDHWDGSIVSKAGYLADHTLFLPVGTEQAPGLKTTDLLILQDVKGFDAFEVIKSWDNSGLPEWFRNSRKNEILSSNPSLLSFRRPARRCNFEIFSIERNETGAFELFLNYSANEFSIGIPQRADHKIAVLSLHQPVRYRINGKSDFTLTGRKQRTFAEYDYILEYIGDAAQIVFRDLNKIATIKTIPLDSCKLIDERKMLQ